MPDFADLPGAPDGSAERPIPSRYPGWNRGRYDPPAGAASIRDARAVRFVARLGRADYGKKRGDTTLATYEETQRFMREVSSGKVRIPLGYEHNVSGSWAREEVGPGPIGYLERLEIERAQGVDYIVGHFFMYVRTPGDRAVRDKLASGELGAMSLGMGHTESVTPQGVSFVLRNRHKEASLTSYPAQGFYNNHVLSVAPADPAEGRPEHEITSVSSVFFSKRFPVMGVDTMISLSHTGATREMSETEKKIALLEQQMTTMAQTLADLKGGKEAASSSSANAAAPPVPEAAAPAGKLTEQEVAALRAAGIDPATVEVEDAPTAMETDATPEPSFTRTQGKEIDDLHKRAVTMVDAIGKVGLDEKDVASLAELRAFTEDRYSAFTADYAVSKEKLVGMLDRTGTTVNAIMKVLERTKQTAEPAPAAPAARIRTMRGPNGLHLVNEDGTIGAPIKVDVSSTSHAGGSAAANGPAVQSMIEGRIAASKRGRSPDELDAADAHVRKATSQVDREVSSVSSKWDLQRPPLVQDKDGMRPPNDAGEALIAALYMDHGDQRYMDWGVSLRDTRGMIEAVHMSARR